MCQSRDNRADFSAPADRSYLDRVCRRVRACTGATRIGRGVAQAAAVPGMTETDNGGRETRGVQRLHTHAWGRMLNVAAALTALVCFNAHTQSWLRWLSHREWTLSTRMGRCNCGEPWRAAKRGILHHLRDEKPRDRTVDRVAPGKRFTCSQAHRSCGGCLRPGPIINRVPPFC